jgi:hypothetical protein
MFFASDRRILLVALLAAALSACGFNRKDNLFDGGATGADLLGFDTMGVLTLTPGQMAVIGVHAKPNVPSARVSLEGTYSDASIDNGHLVFDQNGQASFTLRAPSTPATFGLRAISDSPDATSRLDVAVSADGFANLHVAPHYKGVRPVPSFRASAFVRTTCKDLAKAAPMDGSPARDGAPFQPAIDLPSVPAGANVAVSVRIMHYAVGCLDVPDLAPNADRSISVDVYDRPLDVTALDLEARLTFTPTMQEQSDWNLRMDAAGQLALLKFSPYGTTADEALRLLDAMSAAAMNNSFASSRQSGSWDSKTSSWLGQHMPSMRQRATTWLTNGKPFTLGDQLLHVGPGQPNQQTMIVPTAQAKDSGIVASVPFSAVADADDTLRLEGPLDIWPTALATYGANLKAAIDVQAAKDVPTALAIQLDCSGLSTALLNGQQYAYGSCDQSCMKTLCESGLDAMWSAGRDASQKISDSLEVLVNASGKATVGDNAEPVELLGLWSGSVKGGQYNASTMHGAFKAATGMAPQ